MDQFEKQFHTESRTVRLLESERMSLRERVLGKPKLSPYTLYVLPALRGVAIALSLVLIVMGPVTYGAQESGPGDFLHQLELGVVEPVEASLRLTPSAKRTYHAERLEERLTELKNIEEKSLTAEDTGAVLVGVAEHVEAMVAEDVSDDSPDAETISRLVRTAALLAAHEEVLEDLSITDENLEELSEKVDVTLAEETEEYLEDEQRSEIAAEIARKLDRADDILPEISSRDAAGDFEKQFERIEEDVRDGDLEEAFETATDVEVELLTESYLRGEE